MSKVVVSVFATLMFCFGSYAVDFPAVPGDATEIVVTDGDTLDDTKINIMKNATSVKFTGAGTITAASSLSVVTCPVHVMPGVIFRSTYGGPTALATGAFYIHTGATLYADNSGANYGSTSSDKSGNVYLQGGEGAEGQQGQYVMYVAGSSQNLRRVMAKNLCLCGDSILAAIGTASSVIESSCVIDLQGHFLTWRCTVNQRPLIDSLTVNNAAGGGFIIDGGQFTPRSLGAKTFVNGGEFKFVNNGSFYPSESYRVVRPIDWNFNWDGSGSIWLNAIQYDSSSTIYPFPNTTYVNIGGTFNLLTDLCLTNNYHSKSAVLASVTNYAPIAFSGKVTGPGGINAAAVTNLDRGKYCAISLINKKNDFQGGVRLNYDYLQLFGNGTLPADGGKLTLLDSNTVDFVDSKLDYGYRLPELEVTGDGNIVRQYSGCIDGKWAKITKTGDGELDYQVPLGAEQVDLQEGSIRLLQPSVGNVGLYAGRKLFGGWDPKATASGSGFYVGVEEPGDTIYTSGMFHVTNETAWIEDGFNYSDPTNGNKRLGFMINGGYDWDTGKVNYNNYYMLGDQSAWNLVTNRVANGPETAFYLGENCAKSLRYSIYTYSGYVWNHETTEKTWTIATSCNHFYKIMIGDTYQERCANWNPANGAVPASTGVVFKVTLKPGPNPIKIMMYNQYVNSPTFNPIATNGFENWSYDLGMAYATSDLDDAAAHDGDNYLPFMDPGDGSLFTPEIEARTLSFDEVAIAEGATIKNEISDTMAFAVADLSGTGDIVGNVKVVDSLTIDAADIAAGKTLAVNGTAEFDAGAVVAIEGSLPIPADGVWTIMTANAFAGTPKMAGELAKRWRAEVDGGALKLVAEISGENETLDLCGGKANFVPDYASIAGLNKGHFWFADYGPSAVTKEKDKANVLLSETEPTSAENEKGEGYTKGYFHVTNATELAEKGFNYSDPTNGNKTIGFMVRSGCDWDDKNQYGNNSTGFAGSLTATNETVNSIDIAYDAKKLASHPRYWVFTYNGYIWNDSDSDVTWTIASAFNDHQVWKVNGSQIYKMDNGRTASTNPDRALISLTIHPGPNSFSVRTYNQYVSSPNYYCCATNGFKNATIDFGMGYAKSETDSVDVNDYLRFEDDGSGTLFTTEAVGLARIGNLLMNEDSELDLVARTGSAQWFDFGNVTACGMVSGGNMRITESLMLSTNLVGEVTTLMVDGKVDFASGAVVTLAPEVEKLSGGEHTILTATEITGTPVIDPALADNWELVVDGTTVKLVSSIAKGGDKLSVSGAMRYRTINYAALAGIWEGFDGPFNSNSGATPDYDGNILFSNRVEMTTRCFYMTGTQFGKTYPTGFTKSGGAYQYITYDGYLWNDSNEIKYWTVANAFNGSMKFFLNGTKYENDFVYTSGGATDKGGKVWKDVPLNPGANRFSICVQPKYSGERLRANVATNAFENWNDHSGLMFDAQNRGSSNFVNYAVFEDAGDGKFMTTAAPAAPVFGEVEFETGSSLDLNDPTGEYAGRAVMHTFETVKGAGEFKNGNVKITGSITVAKADLLAGKALNVNGALELGEGATIMVTDGTTLPKTAGPFTLVTATGGITGTATLDSSLAGKWTLEQEGNTIVLKRALKGMLLMFR